MHVCRLAADLDPARFDVVLAVGTPEADEGDLLELMPDLRARLGDRVVAIRGLRRKVAPAGDVRAASSLTRLIHSVRPHVVHTHMAKAGTLGRLTARAWRVPAIVHTFHGTVFQGHFPAAVGRGIAAWERVLARATDAIVAVSPAVSEELARLGLRGDRLHVITYGFDLAPYAAVPPLPADPPPVVTLVARLAPVKDVPLFLGAVDLVRRELPDLEAVIVGDGPLRERLAAEAPPWVSFLGNRGDLPDLLERSGALALSSRSEGLPVALIEALAAARPVASVPVGGVVDILRGRPGAVLARERSAPALADAIRSALTEPEIARGAEKGRAAVVEEFGAARMVREIEDLYERLLAAPHSARKERG